MSYRRVLTMKEIEILLDSDEEIENPIESVTVLPPDFVGYVTEEEIIDEDLIPMNDMEPSMRELAGTFEIMNANDEEVEDLELQGPSIACCVSPPRKRGRPTYKPSESFGKPKWTKKCDGNKEFDFQLNPNAEPLKIVQKNLHDEISGLSPIQLFDKFFDKEMFDFIIKQSNTYAQQNLANIVFNEVILRHFFGILILSGYNTLPSIDDYWSKDPCLGNSIVKQTMSRNKFKEMKRYIHFNNNDFLNKNDKLSKVRPLFDLANKKYIQFGVWSELLSIDEQMVPYFGRQSCKMYIRNKPIRFGYKIWCLCSSGGYLFNCIPYSGSSDNYDRQIGLGADVVLRLLECVEDPIIYRIYFDNFFTSYYLMCLLSEKRFCATGTVRPNRIAKAPLRTGKQLKRGESDYQFDRTNSVLVCRWADNKEVTVLTNFEQIEPMRSVKRWKKDLKKYENVPQPLLLSSYNNGMGGVDLHDNAVSNYRINIRSKKWYWPLFISVLSSSVTNAWKLHCFLEKADKKNMLSQKDFRASVSKALLLSSQSKAESGQDRADSSVTYQLPRIVGEHIPIVQPQGKPRRCQLKGCGKPIKWMCQKCNVHLHPQCFENFHLK